MSASVNINRVSDERYFEDFGRGLYISAISFLPSNAYLYGHGDWWNASFGGDVYQITDPTIAEQYEPYHRLPRITFSGEHELLGNFTGGVNTEFIAFAKDHAVEGQRFDVFPYLAYPIETSAYFVRPQLGYRYTTYSLDHLNYSTNHLLTENNPDRGVPIFSLDTGLIFERGLTFRDSAWTQTLEPRAYYLYVPYRNQNELPVFDTQSIPFSFGELFRTNGFVGADRQMNANNLSLALTTRMLEDATGDERVSASIGEIRYFDDQRVQLPGVAPTDYHGSTYAGEIDLHINDRWRFTIDQQWNPNTEQTDLSAVTLQNRFGSGGLLNLSYRYRRDFLEQVGCIRAGTDHADVAHDRALELRAEQSAGAADRSARHRGTHARTLHRLRARHLLRDLARDRPALDPRCRGRRRQRGLFRDRVQGHRLARPEDGRLPAPWYPWLSMTWRRFAEVAQAGAGVLSALNRRVARARCRLCETIALNAPRRDIETGPESP